MCSSDLCPVLCLSISLPLSLSHTRTSTAAITSESLVWFLYLSNCFLYLSRDVRGEDAVTLETRGTTAPEASTLHSNFNGYFSLSFLSLSLFPTSFFLSSLSSNTSFLNLQSYYLISLLSRPYLSERRSSLHPVSV